MLRILTVAGTRPEAIKLAPLVLAASYRAHLDHRFVATGQHDHLFRQVIDAFGISVDQTLAITRADPSIEALAVSVEQALGPLLRSFAPDVLVVQGDTTSAWAAARAGHAEGVPIAHVEAGLRSHDIALPWPEERNRVEIDALAALLFAPTALAAANLRAESAVTGRVHVTGNTGIDALLAMRARLPAPIAERRPLVLATMHRRENTGAPTTRICDALKRLAARGDVSILVPLHPNPAFAGPIRAQLARCAGVRLVEPLSYPDMVAAMSAARLILSDSGGLQEEAPALGVPLLVLRDNTERPEALATGNIAIVGTDPDRIVTAASRLLDDAQAHAAMAKPAFPYGDGTASEKILDAIDQYFCAS